MYHLYYSMRYLIVLGLVFFLGCKKDADKTAPIVDITIPLENQTFNVMDVISVTGSVNDETQITSVAVSLLNEQQQVAHVSVSATVSSPSMNFNVQYPLDDIHLESGIYYIMVTASDGKNDTRKYLKINLIAVPRVLTKLFVVTNTSSSQTNWGYIDSTFSSIIPYTTFSGDYIGSSCSDYYQQIFNCGNYTGNYSSWNVTTDMLKYVLPASVSSTPCFTGYAYNSTKTYVARYDEVVRGYNYTGGLVYNAQTISGYYTKHFIFTNGVIIAEQQHKISSNKILVVYHANGSPDVQTNIAQDVVTLLEKDNANVFIFGNTSGQATIQLFDRMNVNLWNPYPFSLAPGSILSAVKINSDTYLIGHSNGTIYKYQYQSSSLTTYLTGYIAKQLKYDEIGNKLYVVENNKITRADYPTATMLNMVTTGENILDMHLLYNR